MKIVDICKVVRGSSPRPKADPRFYGGEVPRLMVADVTRDGMYVTPRIDSLTAEGALKSRPMKSGDVVIAVSGAPGLPAILTTDACIHDGFVGLRNLDTTKVTPEFLYRFLNYNKTLSSSGAVGAIFKNLTTHQIRDVEIPNVPITEQTRIAEILDKADAIRRKRYESICIAEVFVASLFMNMFASGQHHNDDAVKLLTLDEAVDKFIDYRGKTPAKSSSGVPLVTAKVIKGGRILPPNEFIPESDYDAWMRRGLPETGDVLFTTEAPLGEIAQVSNKRIALAQRVLLMRGKSGVLNNTFLRLAIKTPFVWGQIERRATGSTVRGIRQKELRKVTIPVPSIQEQNRFEQIAIRQETSIGILRLAARNADDLFNSLVQRAFKGGL